MENFISGLIGALIALSLSSLFSRFSNAVRLNRIRKVIVSYLDSLARNKLDRFLLDSNKTIKQLQQKKLSEEENDGYDNMPMLTSEVLKSFPQSDLFTISINSETYLSVLNFYYAIEFLKNNMPLKIYNEFSEWTNKHLEDKKIPPGEEQFKHIATCSSVDRERQMYIGNIKMVISTVQSLQKEIDEILSVLKGRDLKWVWLYFRK